MRSSFGVFIIAGLFVPCASFSQDEGKVQIALPVSHISNKIVDIVTVTTGEASLSLVHPESTASLMSSKSNPAILTKNDSLNNLAKNLTRSASVLKDREVQPITLDPAIVEVIESPTFRSLLKSLELHDNAVEVITKKSHPNLVWSSDIKGLRAILESNPSSVSGKVSNGSDINEITAEFAFGDEVSAESNEGGTPKEVFIGLSFVRDGKNVTVVWLMQGSHTKRIIRMKHIEADNRVQSIFKSDSNRFLK